MRGESTTNRLSDYIEMREKVDPEIHFIHSLAALLAQFEHIEHDRVTVDPAALGIVHAAVEQSALRVRGALDDFLLIAKARRELETDESD